MIETNQFKKGVKVEINGEPFVIVDFQHVKPGKGNAFTRTRFKSLISGAVIEKTLKSGETLPEADISLIDHDYLYHDGHKYYFMNTQTYEQLELHTPWIEENACYLKENMRVKILFHGAKPVDIELSNFVELEVTYTEPGLRGDTATTTMKPATVETGLNVQVPLHVKIGDILKIDTRTGAYVEKVSKR